MLKNAPFCPPLVNKNAPFCPLPYKKQNYPSFQKKDQEILQKKFLALRAKQTVTIHLTLPNFLISVEIRL